MLNLYFWREEDRFAKFKGGNFHGGKSISKILGELDLKGGVEKFKGEVG